MSWKDLFFKVLTVAAVAVANSVINVAPGLYERCKAWWTGKTVAIIGPTASGKNSMFSRLRKEPIPSEHIQTRGAEKVSSFEVSWPLPNNAKGEYVNFQCRRSINIGGEIDERERYWQQACEGADVIFYLLDAEKLQLDQYACLDRFKDDMRWFVANFSHFKPSIKIHLLLNKIDKTLGQFPYHASALESMDNLLSIMEKEAKSVLAEFYPRVTGVTPISMSDGYLFNKYFAATLSAIAELQQKNEN